MITKELIEYVRGELLAGKTHDDITASLLHLGGWQSSDISEAFAALGATPTVPPVQAMSIAPVVSPTPAPVINIAQPSPTMTMSSVQQVSSPMTPPVVTPLHSSKHGLIGIISLVLGLGISYFSYLSIIPSEYFGKVVILMFAVSLVPVVIFELVTVICKVPNRSWGKAFFMTGVPALALSVIGFIGKGSSSLVAGLLLIPIILGWFLLFTKTYNAPWVKGLLVGILYIIFTGIVMIILFFAIGLSALFGAVNSMQSTSKQATAHTLNQSQDVSSENTVQTVDQNTTVSPTSVSDGSSVDAKIFVPKGTKFTESYLSDLNSNGRKEIWFSYIKHPNEISKGYEYISGDPSLISSWKEISTETGSEISVRRTVTKVIYLNSNQKGPIIVQHGIELPDGKDVSWLWGIQTSDFKRLFSWDAVVDRFENDADFTQTNWILGEVSLEQGEIVQKFYAYNDAHTAVVKSLKLHYVYQNNAIKIVNVDR